MTVGDPDERILVWCARCDMYFKVTRSRYKGVCTKCNNLVTTFRCTRCGATWVPKDPRVLPGTCARCSSPYFASQRVRTPRRSAHQDDMDNDNNDTRYVGKEE